MAHRDAGSGSHPLHQWRTGPSPFIIDVFARKIVGWRVSTSMTTGFVLDALNQAICQRAPSEADKLIHHSDRGSQYLSIRYTERLAEAGIDTSNGFLPAVQVLSFFSALTSACSL